jgi:predicted GIY-YIG superfamily endonuclease
MERTNIYVLGCEGGKYYVGKTGDIARRMHEHLEGVGSAWTTKYKVQKLIEVRTDQSPFAEDAVTKEYMARYGIHNVRGGSYVKEVLDTVQVAAIQKELWSVSGTCLCCGSVEHGAKSCPNVVEKACRRCGRRGHVRKQCYASKNIHGMYLTDSDDEDCSIM